MVGVKIKLFPNNNHLIDNGYTLEEQEKLYDELLQDVIDNPRWYLDNLHSLRTFRVSWVAYGKGRSKNTLPYRHIYHRSL
jgi:hypothetical protein